MTNPLSPKERVKIPRQRMPEQEPAARRQNFEEVNLGLAAALAATEATRCIECADPKCVKGCPVGVKVREFVELVVPGRLQGGGGEDARGQRAARRHRPRLPPGGPVRGGLRHGEEVRPPGHRLPRALHRRLGGRVRRDRPPAPRAGHRQEGGLRGQRPRLPHRRRRPRAEGPRRDRLRGPPRDRRRPRLRHPRVPPPEGHRPPGGREHGEDGRPLRDERGRRAHRHHRRADAGGGLRRRLRGDRRGPAEVPRRPRGEPERRLLRERVPLPRQPDEGLPLPRVRRADLRLPGEAGGRHRRRQHRPRRHPHRPSASAPRRR